MKRYEIPDEVWTLLEPLLPEQNSHQKGHPYKDHRLVLNGIFWVLCSGAPWRDVPERYGSWKTIYNRFYRWSKNGLLDCIFNRLLTELEENSLIDWEAVVLDGSLIRAHKSAAGAKKTIQFNLELMRLVAHEAVLAPKSICQQT
ncbi:IS5 family transposase [Photobacterium swingsii]|uniref:IS5 family transposase n=1 Tax=Photobacterium swingsii TaxID=680026 RepID=UPI0040680232